MMIGDCDFNDDNNDPVHPSHVHHLLPSSIRHRGVLRYGTQNSQLRRDAAKAKQTGHGVRRGAANRVPPGRCDRHGKAGKVRRGCKVSERKKNFQPNSSKSLFSFSSPPFSDMAFIH